MNTVNILSTTPAESVFARLCPEIRFEANRVVSATQTIWVWPLVGGILPVPPNTCAVLTLRQGRRKVFTDGVHSLGPGLAWGPYPVQYVDSQVHRTPIPYVEALCQAKWRAGLAVEVYWCVRDPALVVGIADPIGDLIAAAKASVRALIEKTPHDELIGGTDGNVGDADALGAMLAARLNSIVQGIRVYQVLITDRRGDERRIQITQENTIERTRVIEEQESNRKRLDAEATLVSQEKGLELGRRNLVLLRAETKRKQVEEESKVRIEQARIEAEAKLQLIPVMQQELQLALAKEAGRQSHEQTLRVIDAYKEILSNMTRLEQLETLGVSSRRRPEMELGGLEAALSQGLHNLHEVLQQQPSLVAPPNPVTSSERATLLSRVLTELNDIVCLDGVQEYHLDTSDQECRIKVKFKDRMLAIVCFFGYPSVPPEVRWADNGRQLVPIVWSKEMSLKHILEATQALVDNPAPSPTGTH